LPCAANEAFGLFTTNIHRWWPLNTHSVSAERGRGPGKFCAVEPQVGGRIYERSDQGEEYEWGRILQWNPPQSLRFSWYPARSPETAQEVEVTFVNEGTQARVTLTHSAWEKLGDRAHSARELYLTGWDRVFGECYGNFAQAECNKAKAS
jgi:uncharacterized protein YndB with AHSA1/START domain